jgi:hypothetical protein
MKIYVYGEEHLSNRRVRIIKTTGTIVLIVIFALCVAVIVAMTGG